MNFDEFCKLFLSLSLFQLTHVCKYIRVCVCVFEITRSTLCLFPEINKIKNTTFSRLYAMSVAEFSHARG